MNLREDWDRLLLLGVGVYHLVIGVLVARQLAPEFFVALLSQHVSLIWDLLPFLWEQDRYDFSPLLIACYWYQFFGLVFIICSEN